MKIFNRKNNADRVIECLLKSADRFDSNPDESCGHGIHFCADVKHLINYSDITHANLDHILKIVG